MTTLRQRLRFWWFLRRVRWSDRLARLWLLISRGVAFCSTCDQLFARGDERAMPARERGSLAYCPYCAQMQLRGRKAWAIKNDCNGIFEETTRSRRADVERLLAGEWSHVADGLYLLPVRIYADEEPDFREWEESRYFAEDGDA